MMNVYSEVNYCSANTKLGKSANTYLFNDPLARLKRGGVAGYPDKSGELAKDCLATC